MNEQLLNNNQYISVSLNEIRQETKFTDLSFICRKDTHSIYVQAHQAIFAARSKLLKNLFQIAHQKQPYENVVVNLDSVECTIMEILIEYMYKGEIRVNDTELQKMVELCSLLKLEIPIIRANTILDCLKYEQSILNDATCVKKEEPVTGFNEINNLPVITNVQGSAKLPSNANPKKMNSFIPNRTFLKIKEFVRSETNCNRNIGKITLRKVDKSNYNSLKTSYFYNSSSDPAKKQVNENVECEFPPNISKIAEQPITEKKTKLKKSTKRYQVDYKGVGFNRFPSIRKGEKVGSKKSLKCKFCEKSFSRSQKIDIHIRYRHDNLRQFRCQKCSIFISTKLDLLSHLRTAHSNNERYKCNKCHFTTPSIDHLKRHHKVVHFHIKSRCPKCGMSRHKSKYICVL